MINRNNLNVVSFCSKEESRYTLRAIRVEQGATLATDGHRLAWVSTPSVSVDSFPAVQGVTGMTDTFEPFLLSADTAKTIAKAIPKKNTLPVLNNAAIAVEDGRPALVATDLENPQVFRPHVPEGTFPQYQAVIPKWEEAKFRVTVNARYLAEMGKAFADFIASTQANSGLPVTISFYGKEGPDANQAIRFDATNNEQGMTAVLMPMRHDGEHFSTYGYKERREREAAEREAAKLAQDADQEKAA